MFDVTIVSKPALQLLKTAAKQVPFATSVAINQTAKDFQKVQLAHMESAFIIRRQTFARRAVKIKPFSTKRQLKATVSIDPPGGRARLTTPPYGNPPTPRSTCSLPSTGHCSTSNGETGKRFGTSSRNRTGMVPVDRPTRSGPPIKPSGNATSPFGRRSRRRRR